MPLTEAQKKKIEEEERYKNQIVSTSIQPNTQKHGAPAVLSFFIPGLGQLIKGHVGRGIAIFFGVIFGLMLFVVPGVIIWIWQIADAYNKK